MKKLFGMVLIVLGLCVAAYAASFSEFNPVFGAIGLAGMIGGLVVTWGAESAK